MTLSLEKYHGLCFVYLEDATSVPGCSLLKASTHTDTRYIFLEPFFSSFINFLNLLMLFTSLGKNQQESLVSFLSINDNDHL